MINPSNKLTVFHDDDSVFVDRTEAAADYLRDTFSMTLVAADDYLYLGLYKPFGSTYVELATANTNANTLSGEYWDGSSWTALSLTDETSGLTRSGFLFWDQSLMQAATVNSVEKYYIRLKPSADHTATSVQGINLVFADDTALKQEFFEITNSNLLPSGQSSHISTHVASRNHIVQKLRGLGYIKINPTTGEENITQWDLMDIFEVRQAAVMLALSKIFFNLSDAPEDTWWAKYKEYQNKFDEMFALVRLSIDVDDDGIKDGTEKVAQRNSIRWAR